MQGIIQGPDGRMWLATGSGLQVYDGYTAYMFRGAPGSVEAFPRGGVRTLYLDRRERLWVGHVGGLVRIDPVTDVVERIYRHVPDDPRSLGFGDVTSIHEDRDGRIWVGVLNWQVPEAGGLFRLDTTESDFDPFLSDPADPASLSHNRVRTIMDDADGSLWVGTWHGLNRLRVDGSGFDRYGHTPTDPTSLAYDDVMDLHRDSDGNLWVATIGGGLDRFDPDSDSFEHVPWDGSPYLMAMTEDDRGRLWIATLEDGLAVLQPGAAAVRPVDLGPDADRSGRIDALAISRDGMLWLAGLAPHDGAGRILRMDLEGPVFTFRELPHVQAIAEGTEGDLWMGSQTELLRWDERAGREAVPDVFTCPGLGAQSGLHWMTSIVTRPDGTVWLGYWHGEVGLCRLDPGTDTPVRLALKGDEGGPPTWVSSMAWWEGRLWLASDGDLRAVDPLTGTIETIRHAPPERLERRRGAAWGLATDPGGNLWMSTIAGVLERRRPGSGDVTAFAGAAPGEGWYDFAAIASIRPRADGKLWLATAGFGLCEFDPAEDACVRKFTVEHGLPDDHVMDVLEDDRERVWVATTDELTLIDLDTGTIRKLLLPLSMRGSRFRMRGGALTSTGTASFGTSMGALAFPTGDVGGNPSPPVTRITRVETVGGGDVDVMRVAASREPATLELASDRSDLVFEYVGMHYSDPAANRYAYRLDGLDEAWRHVGHERRARFTNLDPGDYVFRVRSASANGVWSDDATFAFQILAPWWQRPWAVALWAFLVLAGLAAARAAEERRRRYRAAFVHEQAETRRLGELAATRSRVFADLSHEYRTPLALILGQLESARADTAKATSAEVTTRKLEMAERQTRTLQRLTDELLELSRLEAGALDLDLQVMDILPLLRGSIAAFHSAAAAAGVDLRFESLVSPLLVRHDPERMRRVVTNLLSNALKFTPGGGKIVVTADRSDDGQACVAVEDSGPGIPPAARGRIFDRFFQVNDAGDDRGNRAMGTGIGLALVRELVELHGGSIGVESEIGEGTRFEILLPAVPEEAILADESPGNDEPADPSASDRELVLVVEDHADMRAFLRQELTGAYRVEEAVDGADGLARAIDLVPDLVITDAMMPEMDGYELVRRLRADERTSHIPIIMLTGHASEEARVAGLQSGVDDFLPKPFSARVLLLRVSNLLDIRRLLRERYSGDVWLKPEEIEAPSVEQKFLERVAQVVEERMSDQAFSVEELASSVYMSRSQLHRKLTALVDRSPGALIRGMRLRRAADLIRSGSRQLSQIAFDVGFSDQAHFTRSFKRHFGCTPSAYREAAEANEDNQQMA